MKRKETGGWCFECMAFGHFQGCPLAPDEDEQEQDEEEDDCER